ncbi:MAG: glycoside hydrolase family 88 protein [Chitinispirillaceae bacterium]|nr:glycoside hydrolase family 88 protein [Chitinispirillaceae bacterium]
MNSMRGKTKMATDGRWVAPVRIIFLVLCLLIASTGTYGQTLPSKARILEKMKLANDYFINDRNHDPCTNCLAGILPSNIWTRAVYYEGALAYFAVSKDSAALAHAVKWGTFHSWNISSITTTNADDQCAGQSYIDLYRLDEKPERIANIKACIDRMMNNSSNNFWTWIDAIQMAMPIFAKLGVQYDDTKYFDKMYRLFNYPKTTLGLYNQKDSLWWRDETFKSAKSPSGKNIYWSRGNGWVFAALVRVLDELPSTDSHREEYETIVKEMAGALKEVQRSDGFWNENLADPDHFGGPEVTGTGLFTFGMAWGINNGLLSAADYLPTIEKAWGAIADSAIFSNGKLGYVQGTGDSPGANGHGRTNVTPSRNIVPDFDDYGLGCVLLAGSEVAKLAGGQTGLSRTRNPSISRPAVHKVFGNRPVAVDLPHGTPIFLTLFDLTGKVVARKRVHRGALDHIHRLNCSEKAYVAKTVCQREWEAGANPVSGYDPTPQGAYVTPRRVP